MTEKHIKIRRFLHSMSELADYFEGKYYEAARVVLGHLMANVDSVYYSGLVRLTSFRLGIDSSVLDSQIMSSGLVEEKEDKSITLTYEGERHVKRAEINLPLELTDVLWKKENNPPDQIRNFGTVGNTPLIIKVLNLFREKRVP